MKYFEKKISQCILPFSLCNNEIETNLILNSCEIPIEQRNNIIAVGNDYLPNLTTYKEAEFSTNNNH